MKGVREFRTLGRSPRKSTPSCSDVWLGAGGTTDPPKMRASLASPTDLRPKEETAKREA
jgi:hypothetical protein